MKNLAMGFAVAALVALSAQTEARPKASLEPGIPPVTQAKYEVGLASWYGEECDGYQTASGEVFDMNGLSAAHRDYPLGTKIKVTNLKNNRSIILRINDRGPSIQGRLLDVSMAAAFHLGFLGSGLARVRIDVLSYPGKPLSKATEPKTSLSD